MPDYAALAAQYGAIKQQSDSAPIDYDALAAAHGAIQLQNQQPIAKPTVLEKFKNGLNLDALKRVGGLTARAALEGAGDIAGIIGNPISNITGGALRRPSEISSDIATSLNLPVPATPSEKFVNAAGRGMVGAGGIVGTGNILARTPGMIGKAGEFLASQPIAQIVSGATSGGTGELARQSGIGENGQLAASLAGGIAPTAIPKLIVSGGKLAADVIGNIGTHTGGEPLKQAAIAGLEGGEKAKSFIENLRGNVPKTDVLDTAKENLRAMQAQKSADYRSGMVDISKDKSVLDFSGIDNALKNAEDMTQFKGQTKNTKAADVQQQIADEISNWKKLNPDEYHTAEGLDALKQKIGGIVDGIPFEEKTARMVGNTVYNSIKNEITKQAPTYSKTMKDYTDATDQIREIEKTLSLGDKSQVDTAMRKLQSLMRNNVNTNYGSRLELAKQLEQQGGQEIMPALAGQSLQELTPRGLGKLVAGSTLAGGVYASNPWAALLLAAQSPHLMGEAAYYTGKGAGLAKPLAPAAYSDMQNALSKAALISSLQKK